MVVRSEDDTKQNSRIVYRPARHTSCLSVSVNTMRDMTCAPRTTSSGGNPIRRQSPPSRRDGVAADEPIYRRCPFAAADVLAPVVRTCMTADPLSGPEDASCKTASSESLPCRPRGMRPRDRNLWRRVFGIIARDPEEPRSRAGPIGKSRAPVLDKIAIKQAPLKTELLRHDPTHQSSRGAATGESVPFIAWRRECPTREETSILPAVKVALF